MKRLAGLLGALFGLGLILATAAWPAALEPASPEEVGLSSARLALIEKAFGEAIAAKKLPGAVIMVARHGRLAYVRALGDRDPASGAAMSEDAIFRIYSMTKPLVSVAAMILVEEGRLQLADPVSKHLPAFKDMVVSVPVTDGFGRTSYRHEPAAREMTVQDLLRHTAGLAYGELTGNAEVREAYAAAGLTRPGVINFDLRALSPEAEVKALAAAPLIHQPGTVWEYSLASDLLGRVIEAASGERLGDFLAQRLFTPLAMADAGFSVPEAALGRVAEPFALDPATGEAIPLIDVSAVPGNDSGGAGGVATAGDYLRFAEMMRAGGTLDGARILEPATVALMASDHLRPAIAVPLGPGYSFGLGVMVRDATPQPDAPESPGAFMWGGYAGTYFWVDPAEALVAVLMTQAAGRDRPRYPLLLKTLVYRAIID